MSAVASPAASIAGMGASLVLVLALIVALAWLVRRTQGLRPGGGSGVRVLGGTSVGARERVLLVEAAGRHFLLGVAPGAVNLLHRYDEALPEEIATPVGMSPFAQKLQALLAGKGK